MHATIRRTPRLRTIPALLLAFAAGCESPGTSLPVPDTAAPVVSLAAPADGAVVDADSVQLRGTLADDEGVTRATYQVNGGAEREIAIAPGDTVAFAAAAAIPAGTSTLVVHAYDAAGNRGSSAPLRATRAELFTITSPRDGETVHTQTVRLTSASARPFDIERITFQVNGGEETHYPRYVHHGAYYYAVDAALRDGENTIAVHAYPAAGGARVTREVRVRYVELARIRLSAPAMESWAPGVVRAGVDTLTVAGTAFHGKGVARVTYRVEDGPETEVPVAPADSVAFRVLVRLVGYGGSPVTLSAYDPAGNRASVVIPVAHPAPPEVAGVFATVSAGQDFTCGRTPAGAAHCWGGDNQGQLGNGGSSGGEEKWEPGAVAGGLAFRAVVANRGGGVGAGGAESFACGIAEGGALFCWGSNSLGELGLGSGQWSGRLSPAEVFGGRSYAQVALGARHSCALTTAGEAWCWGANQEGQLGNGATTPYLGTGSSNPAPTPVRGGLRFRALAAGWAHTCALTEEGEAFCWGGNAHGQLGTGTVAGSLEPVAVTGGLRFRAITTGDNFTCGLVEGGAAYCWGVNDARQLGTGSAVFQVQRPTPVAGGLAFSALSGGQKHACGVSGGKAYCWGQPQFSSSMGAVPTHVGGPSDFREVSAGYRHSCGVTENGAAFCWGTGENGRLGNGTTLTSAAPLRVTDPR